MKVSAHRVEIRVASSLENIMTAQILESERIVDQDFERCALNHLRQQRELYIVEISSRQGIYIPSISTNETTLDDVKP